MENVDKFVLISRLNTFLTSIKGWCNNLFLKKSEISDWALSPEKPTYTAEDVGALPDSTTIPSELSQLGDDSNHRLVTDDEKTTWDNKSNFSGSYNDLTDKPTKLSQFEDDLPNYSSIPNSWVVNDSMRELIDSINADDNAVPGKSYLGTVYLSDLPGGMIQAELIIDVMSRLGNNGDKVIVFQLSSSNLSPYHWEYTSAYGDLGTWRSWLVADDIVNKEDKFNIVSTPKTSSFTASVGNYYFVNIAANSSITVTLSRPADNSHSSNIILLVTTSTSSELLYDTNNGISIIKSKSYSVEDSSMYEINIMWNGVSWIIANVELVAS